MRAFIPFRGRKKWDGEAVLMVIPRFGCEPETVSKISDGLRKG